MGSISFNTGRGPLPGKVANENAGEEPEPPLTSGTLEVEAVGTLDAQLTGHVPYLVQQARRLTTSTAQAQDLVQDTLERAVKSIARFVPGTNMRAWLYTILVRRACDIHRQERQRRHRDTVEPDTLPSPLPEQDCIWVHVTEQELAQAVQALRPMFREVFELHEVHQLAYQDIALRLGIPVSTVGTRLRRARTKLRKLLMKALQKRGVAL